MAANATSVVESVDEQLWALTEEFPASTSIYQDVLEESAWFYAEAGRGALDQFAGRIVAVYNRQVVAVGDDERTMRVQLARQYSQHPDRFYLVLHGE